MPFFPNMDNLIAKIFGCKAKPFNYFQIRFIPKQNLF